MTEAQFRSALYVLAEPGEASWRMFYGHSPEDWTAAALRYGSTFQARRRERDVHLGLLMLILAVGVFVTGLLTFHNAVAAGAVAVLSVWIVSGISTPFAPPRLTPLVTRLDDVRLVPFWLEGLTDLAYRSALHERLARRLPDYREPLAPAAEEALRSEMRRLCDREALDAGETAFLIAALVSLERADPPTLDALERLRPASSEHLQAAAEDALLRLRL